MSEHDKQNGAESEVPQFLTFLDDYGFYHAHQGLAAAEAEFGLSPSSGSGSMNFLDSVRQGLQHFQAGQGFHYIDSKGDRNLHERLVKLLTEPDEPQQLLLTNCGEPACSAPAHSSPMEFEDEDVKTCNILVSRNPDDVAAEVLSLIPTKSEGASRVFQRTPEEVAAHVGTQILGNPRSLHDTFIALDTRDFLESTVAALRALGETETVQKLLNLLTIEGELLKLLMALPPDSNEHYRLHSCMTQYCSGVECDPREMSYGFLWNVLGNLIEVLKANPDILGEPEVQMSQADRELAEIFALVPLPELDTPSSTVNADNQAPASAPQWPDVIARFESAKGDA